MDPTDPIEAHRRAKGKIEILPRIPMDNASDLTTYYTPGVADVANLIARSPDLTYQYTSRANMIAIVSDGTRLLGLGNVGPYAATAVMESKSVIYKRYGGVDAIPLCLKTTDENEIISTCKYLEPSFGLIHLEDIESPKCFVVQERLAEQLSIPVFHDDRHGTSVVALAGVINALKLSGKKINFSKVVVNGAGAAGLGIAELLAAAGVKEVYALDSKGLVYKGRKEGMNQFKEALAEYTNKKRISGHVNDVIEGADIFISAVPSYKFDKSYIAKMAEKPAVFALSNPTPEISYAEAKKAGAFIAATGRSDDPNQINNMICYPSITRGLLDTNARGLNKEILLAAAKELAKSNGKRLSAENVIPTIRRNNPISFMPNVAEAVAKEVIRQKLARLSPEPSEVKRSMRQRIKRYIKIEKKIVGRY
jgi:malate dehydrogenase (oxaloacetate-decarboxylating)